MSNGFMFSDNRKMLQTQISDTLMNQFVVSHFKVFTFAYR